MKMRDKVMRILKNLSQLDEIDKDSTLQGTLGFDSLCMVTLLVELEDALGIELDESDMNPFDLTTAEDVIALAERYAGVQHLSVSGKHGGSFAVQSESAELVSEPCPDAALQQKISDRVYHAGGGCGEFLVEERAGGHGKAV